MEKTLIFRWVDKIRFIENITLYHSNLSDLIIYYSLYDR